MFIYFLPIGAVVLYAMILAIGCTMETQEENNHGNLQNTPTSGISVIEPSNNIPQCYDMVTNKNIK